MAKKRIEIFPVVSGGLTPKFGFRVFILGGEYRERTMYYVVDRNGNTNGDIFPRGTDGAQTRYSRRKRR